MYFGSMDELRDIPAEALPRPLTFPKDHVASIAAQITMVFERLCLNRTTRRDHLGIDIGDEDAFKKQDAVQVVSGSKQDLRVSGSKPKVLDSKLDPGSTLRCLCHLPEETLRLIELRLVQQRQECPPTRHRIILVGHPRARHLRRQLPG